MKHLHHRIGWRKRTLGVVLWAFGLSTTLFLIGMWGRAVVVDEATVSRSVGTALEAESIADHLYRWLADGLEEAAGLPEADVEASIAAVRGLPETDTAVTDLVDQAVRAVMAPAGTSPVIDVAGTLRPLVPAIESALAGRGYPVDGTAVAAALDELDPVALEGEGVIGIATISREARAALTVVVALTLSSLLITGATAVALSDDRTAMVRSLLTRVAISGFTYAIIFRVGGWLLNPNGGRSPLLGSGGVLLASNLHVFVAAAGGTALAAVMLWSLSRRRRGSATAWPEAGGDDEPTRELAAV